MKLPELLSTSNANAFLTEYLGHRLRIYRRAGNSVWRLRIRRDGADKTWSLQTADLPTAHERAVEKAASIMSSEDAWDTEMNRLGGARNSVRLGEIIDCFINDPAPRTSQATREEYIRSLRLLVREALGIKPEMVDRVFVRQLTGKLVRRFQAKRLAGIPEGTGREKKKNTANSVLGNARGVFARRVIRSKIYPQLPDLTSFLEAPDLPAIKVVYRYETMDRWCRRVIDQAHTLRESDPAAYLMFRLCAECGLRRTEAGMARKNWLDTHRGQRVIYVQATPEWLPKGRAERRVPLPEDLYHDLIALGDGSDYLLPAQSDNMRRRGVGRRLAVWFDDLGWPFEKKVHELRKWFGAQIATQTGSLFATQRILGHSRVETTNQYYSDLTEMPEYSIASPTSDSQKTVERVAG